MTGLFLLTLATLLTQAPDPSEAPAPTKRVVVRENGHLVEVFGQVMSAQDNVRVLTVQIDAPWDMAPSIKNFPMSDVVRQEDESPRDHERRIRKGFEERGMTLLGPRYWVAADWVSKDELTWAEKSRDMVLKVQASSTPTETGVAEPQQSAPAAPPSEEGKTSGMAYRGIQALIGLAALVLIGVVAKVFVF